MRNSEHPRYRKKGLKRLLAGMLCMILILTSSAVTVLAEESADLMNDPVMEEQAYVEAVPEEAAEESEPQELVNEAEEPVESEEELEDRLCGEDQSILKWCYDRDLDGFGDCYVENCKIYLLDADGNEKPLEDEVSHLENLENRARYVLEVGQTYELRIVPDYGYRVRNLRYNDYTLIPTDKYGVYSFTMGHNKFRLWDVVEEIPPEELVLVNVNSSVIAGYSVMENNDGNKLEEAISESDERNGGLFRLVVEDAAIEENLGIDNEYSAVGAVKIDPEIVLYNGMEGDYGQREVWVSEALISSINLNGGNYTISFKLNEPYFEEEENQIDFCVVCRDDNSISERLPDDNLEVSEEDGRLVLTYSGVGKPCGTFTFFREDLDDAQPSFTLDPVVTDESLAELSLVPAEGASGLFVDEGNYFYQGSGDIRLQLKKDGEVFKDTMHIEDGFSTDLRCLFFVLSGNEEEEPLEYDASVDQNGVVTLFAISPYNGDLQIKELLDHAKAVNKNISVKLQWDMPHAASMVLNEGNDVDIEYDDSLISEDGEFAYIKPDAEKIRFKVDPDENDEVLSVTGTPVNLWTEKREDNSVEIAYDEAGGRYATELLTPDADGWYEMDVPQPEEWEFDRVLGIKLNVNVEKRNKVSVKVEDLSFTKKKASVELFDVTIRVGSKTYPVEVEENETSNDTTDDEYYAFVPMGATVTASVSSKDDLWTVTGVKVTDAKNSGKDQKASKTGEYTIQTLDNKTDESSLELQVSAVAKLLITDTDDNELIPENKKYNLGKDENFKASVLYGSTFEEGGSKPYVWPNTTFRNGTKDIGTCVTLETNGTTLKTPKSLTLKASFRPEGQNKDTTLSATFAFSELATTATISPTVKGDSTWIQAPFGTKTSFTVKYNAGANTKGVTAKILAHGDSGDYEYGDISCFGTFNGTTLVIDPAIAKNDPGYLPENAYYGLALYNKSGTEIGYWSLNFPAPSLTNDAHNLRPSVKANDALSSVQEIGLSLTLPKKMKAMNGLYYRIEASTQKEEWTEDENPSGAPRDRDNLSYYRDEYDDQGIYTGSRHVDVYKETVVAYVPSSEKTWALNLADDPITVEDGWFMEYNVKAQMVYAIPSDDTGNDNGYLVYTYGDELDAQPFTNKEHRFETKLALTKKTPAKIMVGMTDVPIAVPKWSKTTTVRGLDRVELLNEFGNSRGHWNRWDAADNPENNKLLDVDPVTGMITLDTTRMEDDEDGEEWLWSLEPGKYSIVAYAIAGPGKETTATLPITLLEPIRNLSVSAPGRVLKTYGKAATVKADVAYNTAEDWYGVPAVKKVDWSVKQVKEVRADGTPKSYKDIEDGPLAGMITVKNGTATIDKSLLVDSTKDAGAYTFVIAASAADFEGNPVTGYSDPIVISSEEQIPTTIRFAWEQWRNDVFTGYDFSRITEQEIRNNKEAEGKHWYEPFFSNQIQHSKVFVYDQYGHGMAADLKLSGVKQNEEGKLVLEKPGKVSITATAQDGSKKSKKIEFTIDYADERYVPNLLIQEPMRNDPNGDPFLNCNDPWNEFGEKGTENDAICNPLPANKPIYVHVAGVRNADILFDENDEPVFVDRGGRPDFGDNGLLNHKLVVSGGKIKKTFTGYLENYTTYEILPDKHDMTITLTDNTVSAEKTPAVYFVKNQAIPKDTKAKAPTIKADKTSIYSWMFFERSVFEDGDGNVNDNEIPNHVEYALTKDMPTIDDGKTLAVRLYMDEIKTDGQHMISGFLGLSTDDWWQDARIQTEGLVIPLEDGVFSIDYFEERTENWGEGDVQVFDSMEIPAGSYDFYVSVGQANRNGEDLTDFEALAKPVKITVKVANAPAPKQTSADKAPKIQVDADKKAYAAITEPVVANSKWVLHDYEMLAANTNGQTNLFRDLFEVGYDDNDNARIVPRLDGMPEIWMAVGSGKNIKYVVMGPDYFWYELSKLKNGKLYVRHDDEKDAYVVSSEDDDEAELLVDKKAQQAAYKNFVKTHCTGFMRYNVVGVNGSHYTFTTPITIGIDDFVDYQGVHGEPQG